MQADLPGQEVDNRGVVVQGPVGGGGGTITRHGGGQGEQPVVDHALLVALPKCQQLGAGHVGGSRRLEHVQRRPPHVLDGLLICLFANHHLCPGQTGGQYVGLWQIRPDDHLTSCGLQQREPSTVLLRARHHEHQHRAGHDPQGVALAQNEAVHGVQLSLNDGVHKVTSRW